jgi:hypothetical protein
MSGEKKMWDYLGPKLRFAGHFERIESHATALGTPDVNYCIRGYNNHIELKYTEKENGCILRPSQCGWFKKRVKAKGQPWLLLHANIRQTRGYALIPGCNVPPLVHTKNVLDWMQAGVMVWKDKIEVEELIHYLSTYLVAEEQSSGTPKEESSGLILPPHHPQK